MIAYFLLIEEETDVAPPHDFIVLATGERVKAANSDQPREWVLSIAERVRAARRELGREIPVRQPPGKCRSCGMKEECGQGSR